MGTKANPSAFDCYENAADDEPMFVLLARDRIGADLVRKWADVREQLLAEDAPESERYQITEARECAIAMDAWRAQHRASVPAQ